MLNEAELNELNVSESDSHLDAMKRYREFRSLHTKLLKSSSFAQHIKGTVEADVLLVHMSFYCSATQTLQSCIE